MKTIRTLALITLIAGLQVFLTGCSKPPAAESQSDINVVVLAPMTGPGASIGEFIRNGVEIGKSDLIKHYGTNSLHLAVELIDSKNQPKEGLSAYQAAKLKARPDAVIVSMSSVSKALQPVAEADETFMVATTTALSGLPQGTRNVVRIYPTSEDFVAPTADYMAQKFTKIAVFFVNDDFGRSNREALAARLAGKSKKIYAEDSFDLTQTEHRNSVQRMLERQPDVIFVTGYGPAYIALLKQIKESAAGVPICTEMSLANPAVLKALGSAAEGLIFAGTDLELSNPETEAGRSFAAEYKSKFGAEPYMVAGFVRDSLQLVLDSALKNVQNGKPGKASALKLSPLNGCIGAIHLDDQGECHIPLRLMQRKGSQTIPFNF